MQPSTEPAGEGASLGIASVQAPVGGGAIRGIGERFAVNPSTGTASLTLPLPFSPGRAGFGPVVALRYDSGGGNGPFGFGWSLELPQVSRQTERGLPTYRDGDDTFVLSGAEDLVPVGADATRTVDGVMYAVRMYQPRVEGLYARIERWTDSATGVAHWRSISGDNVTTVYGRDASCRVADPVDPRRVFTWLISDSFDGRGHAVRYDYFSEDTVGVDTAALSEATRTDRGAQRYPARIRYGNVVSCLVEPVVADDG